MPQWFKNYLEGLPNDLAKELQIWCVHSYEADDNSVSLEMANIISTELTRRAINRIL